MDFDVNSEVGIDLSGGGANTLVEYAYRDENNSKVSASVVLAGRLSPEGMARIAAGLDERFYFIPGQVGLRDLQGDFTDGGEWGEADHVWHHLVTVSHTDAEATSEGDTRDVETLLEAWPVDSRGWDDEGHYAELAGDFPGSHF